MGLQQDLAVDVKNIFADQWQTRKGQVVPSIGDLKLTKDAVEFDRATVLYADLNGSTAMVDGHDWRFAAEVYKAFLHCAARIINAEDGTITAYDGDRVMALFLGGTQTSTAARCGLKINYAVKNIINPAIKAQYPTKNYAVRQVVGIDTSPIRAARTGVRGDNDIVWVGRAANYAAKLTAINREESTWLTEAAYGSLLEGLKVNGNPAKNIWGEFTWNAFGNRKIFGSNWTWSL